MLARIRGTLACAVTLALALSLSAPLKAEPTSDQLTILSLRPYMDGPAGIVYVHVSSTAFCNTDTFAIDMSRPGAKPIPLRLTCPGPGRRKHTRRRWQR